MPYADAKEGKRRHAEYLRKRYREDEEYREKHKALVRANKAKYAREVDRLLAEFRKNGCSICDEREPCCLSAHHLGEKEFTIGHGRARNYSPRRIAKELAKCICVCENCHRKIHAGIIDMRGQLLVEQEGS